MSAKDTRLYYRIIRNLETMPSDVLPNQLTAAETAHLCIVADRVRRTSYKARHKRVRRAITPRAKVKGTVKSRGKRSTKYNLRNRSKTGGKGKGA